MPTSEPDHDLDRYPELARYSRQMLFGPIGVEGQRRLGYAQVVLVGCGALGSVIANTLVRAGVGGLRIVDRDFVEIDNLQRQVLFDEHDIAQDLPKAEAAARKLRRANSAVEVRGVVADVSAGSIRAHCGDADLVLDGTDNLETRYLINDFAVQQRIPWVFGACLGAQGLMMAILPGRTPCLRCVWEQPPAPGTLPTCETAGVLAATVNMVASLQSTEAMKILMGREEEVIGGLTSIDAWTGRVHTINVRAAREQGECPCCRQQRYEFLTGARAPRAHSLCGRDAVQIVPGPEVSEGVADFRSIASRLPPHANAHFSEFLLRFVVESYRVTLFRDGRAIVQGTGDPATARSVLARYVGL